MRMAVEKEKILQDDIMENDNDEGIDLLTEDIPLPSVSDDSLKDYLNKISEYSHFSREKEYELGKRIQAGDEEAVKELVLANLKFVISVANRYRNSGLSMSDIINQGNLGLIEAARRFDPDRGVKFISYAVWWIRQSIIQALAEQSGTVKLPIKQASILYKINEATEKLSKELGRDPNADEIANYLEMDVNDVENILRVSRNYLSLEAPIKDGEDRSFIDLLDSGTKSVEDEIIETNLKNSLEEIVDELPEREATIVKLRFGLEGETPKTLEEIGEMMNISRERVRQIESRALLKLKKKALKRKLYDYLN
ncbi:MAG: RNA polymerase sigma factor RpoD/SigA [Deferribacterales bacterium]|nr:RNA polymerase sigma factor RpoD/SigA [Deferribacterales bacterium]